MTRDNKGSWPQRGMEVRVIPKPETCLLQKDFTVLVSRETQPQRQFRKLGTGQQRMVNSDWTSWQHTWAEGTTNEATRTEIELQQAEKSRPRLFPFLVTNMAWPMREWQCKHDAIIIGLLEGPQSTTRIGTIWQPPFDRPCHRMHRKGMETSLELISIRWDEAVETVISIGSKGVLKCPSVAVSKIDAIWRWKPKQKAGGSRKMQKSHQEMDVRNQYPWMNWGWILEGQVLFHPSWVSILPECMWDFRPRESHHHFL